MLTPIDIQNHTLKTSMSGYNKKDTEEFLASILDSYETLFRENRTLKEKITSLSEGIQYYKQMENTLQKALILAEKTSTETQEAAKAEADSLVKDAQSKADSIIRDIKAEADATKAEAKAALKESEEKSSRLIKEAEEKADATKAEAEASAEETTKKAGEKAETVIKEAEAKAALIISEAEKEASGIKSKAQDELDGIRVNAIRLVQDYENYCYQVEKLAKAQLALLESNDYKLHVTELNIDNNIVKKDKEAKPDIKDTENIVNTSIDKAEEEQENHQEEAEENLEESKDMENKESKDIKNKDTENSNVENNSTKNSDIEKFSWNSDGNKSPAIKEQDKANPFTFIDPE